MTQRLSEERLEREIRRFLESQSADLAAAPTEAEMVQRIAARRRAARRGASRLVLALAVIGLLATMGLGLVLTGAGSPPTGPLALATPTPTATTTATSAAPASASRTAQWTPGPMPPRRPIDTSAKRSIAGLTGDPEKAKAVTISAAEDDGVWIALSGRSVLVHVDRQLGPTRYALPEGRAVAGDPLPSGDDLWVVTTDLEVPTDVQLHRLDVRTKDIQTFPLATVEPATPIAVGDEGVWLADRHRLVLIDRTNGRELRSSATRVGAHAFGSFWGYSWDDRPAVTRYDARTAERVATIELTPCLVGAPGSAHEANFHVGRVYAVEGATGIPQAIVATCPLDSSDRRSGPDVLIDPAADAVVGTIDLGADHGDGVVVGGRWWHVAGTTQGPGNGLGLGDPRRGRASLILELDRHAIDGRLVATGDALWVLLSDCGAGGCAPGDDAPFLLRLEAEDLERAIAGGSDRD